MRQGVGREMPNKNEIRRRRGSLPMILAGVVLAIVLVLLTQQALALSLGRFVAWLWVSTMDVVLGILGGVLGGG